MTSGYSYPRVVVIRIDVLPTGKTWYTWHICFLCQSTYTSRTLPVSNFCTWQPFMESSIALDKATALEKKRFPTTSLAHRLTNLWLPTQFLSLHNHWSSRGKDKHLLLRNQVDRYLVWLWWVIDLARFEFESRIVLFYFFYLCFVQRIAFPYLVVCRWQVRHGVQRWGLWQE
jgi:hypothetical protein